MSKLLVVLVTVAVTVSLATTTFAATAKEVGAGMGHKLARGITNAGTGWIELFKEMYNTGKENPFLGLTAGSVKGSAKAVVRTSAGGIEAGTFLFPVPKNYHEPLIEPEYVF